MKSLFQSIGITCLLACCYFQAYSQNTLNSSSPHRATVGIHAGTQGIGITATKPLTEQLGARLGVSFLPFNTSVNKKYGQYNTSSEAKARFSNVQLALDWAPLYAKENFFRHLTLSAGAAYFFKADGDLESQLTDPYFYGDIEVAPEDIGTLYTNISWKNSVAPYLAVGFSNIAVDDNLALGFSLGSYYLPSPSVSIVGTELLQDNAFNAPIIEENAKDYRFLPVLQVNFSYKIK